MPINFSCQTGEMFISLLTERIFLQRQTYTVAAKKRSFSCRAIGGSPVFWYLLLVLHPRPCTLVLVNIEIPLTLHILYAQDLEHQDR